MAGHRTDRAPPRTVTTGKVTLERDYALTDLTVQQANDVTLPGR
ncbi:hypothetical protein [Streptomyces sp. Ag109_O5-1]|nr:hypothetical protein [Streptomyces sp. Ag109_O5-1]